MLNGKIIKSDGLAGTIAAAPRKVIRRDVDTASRRATEILEAAQAHASEVLRAAEAQRSQVLRAAAEKGYEDGLRRWNEILITASNRLEETIRRHEQDLIKLAVRMAEKIIGERLNEDPACTISIVSEALKSVRRERSLTIQVNPDSVELVQGKLEELKARIGGAKDIWVEGNPQVKTGGCIIQSDVGVIDARIETQLRCMEQALLQTKK